MALRNAQLYLWSEESAIAEERGRIARDIHDGLAQSLALRGYVTAAIEYRLADEAKFPAAVQDCHAAVRWLRANAKEHDIDPDQIGAVGGSAGGHLVGLVAAAPDVKELQGEGGNASHSSQLQAAVS